MTRDHEDAKMGILQRTTTRQRQPGRMSLRRYTAGLSLAILGSWLLVSALAQGFTMAETEGVSETSAASLSSQPHDFGDFTSTTLTTKAWLALEAADYPAVLAYTKKCIDLYHLQADQQAATLTGFAPAETASQHWALNDVATSYFILGQAYLAEGRAKKAQEVFQTISTDYPHAQAWDTGGWFWKVAEAAQEKLQTLETGYDFGDSTSSTLTTKAWTALANSDHAAVDAYVRKCLMLYSDTARTQQASLTNFIDWKVAGKEKVFEYWALNDVGTCFFIFGESLMAQQRYPEAKAAYERVIRDFSYAQAWDPQGWFWKVATAARERLNKILVLGSDY